MIARTVVWWSAIHLALHGWSHFPYMLLKRMSYYWASQSAHLAVYLNQLHAGTFVDLIQMSRCISSINNETWNRFVINIIHLVGINFFESASCWENDWWNTAMPATIPATMNRSDIMDQITPQHWEDPPYLLANTLASELLTFRRMRSSQMSQTLYSDDMTPIKSWIYV